MPRLKQTAKSIENRAFVVNNELTSTSLSRISDLRLPFLIEPVTVSWTRRCSYFQLTM